MNCPHCRSTATSKRKHRTALGYRRFSCRSCRVRFNERTGTPFNDLQFPTGIATHKRCGLTTDRHPAYGMAIRWILGRKVMHLQSRYLNNRIEQDHRAIRQCYDLMQGFRCMESGKRLGSVFDELRQYMRIRPRSGEKVLLPERRRVFLARWQALTTETAAA